MNSPAGAAGSGSPAPVSAAVASRKAIKTDPISMLLVHPISFNICCYEFWSIGEVYWNVIWCTFSFQAKVETIAQIHILTRMPVVPIVVIQKEHMITPL